MINDAQQRFDAAYELWQTDPAAISFASSWLLEISESVQHFEGLIAPVVNAYAVEGRVLPPPMQGWHDGMSYLIEKQMPKLKRLRRLGRQQVATREVMGQAEKLRNLWSAYRAVTGQ